ncbi:hypothetical protein MKW92_036411 [Papaver armeniacum]|nr:hypothetical protein MKW92_036411 [Papaver armeniacum]
MEILLPCNLSLVFPLFFLLPLCFVIIYKTRNIDDQNKPNFPPGPPKLPIIGNLHQLAKPPHQALSKLSKTYGPVMLLQLGSIPTLIISSAEAAEQVLKTLDLDFCNRPQGPGPKRFSYDYKDVAFVPYGEYWREIRKICVHELLSTKRMQSFKAVRAEEIDALLEFISSCSNTTPLDVFEMLSSITHQTMCRVTFGQSRNQSNGRLTEILYEVTSVLGGFFATDFFPKVGWVVDRITGMDGRIEKCFHDFDELFQQMIEEHLDPVRPKPEYEDLMDILLELENGQTSTIRLANENIKAILMVTFKFL